MSIPTQLIAVARYLFCLLVYSVPRNEHPVEMQSGGDDPSTEISDLTSQPVLPSADRDKQEVLWGLDDSISKPRDNGLSSAKMSTSQPPSVSPIKPQHPPKTTGTHPSISQSIISFAIDRRFILPSLICLFAFLLYILPSLSPDIFSFRKFLSSDGLA